MGQLQLQQASVTAIYLISKYGTQLITYLPLARTEANRGFRPSQGHLNTTPAASSARVASTRKALSKGAAQGGRGKQAENKKVCRRLHNRIQ